MAALTRVLQKIFGLNGTSSQFGKIGSESAGSPVTTKDLALIQSLSQFTDGLYAITGNGNELPRLEDINSMYYLITSQLAYMFQSGIPEYDATTNYYNLISFVSSGGVIYQSIAGTGGAPNIGNDPASSPTKWQTNDAVVEKVRALAAEALLAPKASPTFTGTPLAPTAAIGTNTTQLATTAFVELYLKGQTKVQGLTLSNDGSSPNTVLDIAAGAAVDTTFADLLILASAYTKTTGAWAVGTGNGGLDTGSIGAASWYSVWIIKRPDTGVVDILFSLSATAPTMPANYTLKRRIGWFKTASSNIVTFVQVGDSFQWKARVGDRAAAAPASTNRILVTVTCPVGTRGEFFIIQTSNTSSVQLLTAGPTSNTDVAAANSNKIFATFTTTEVGTFIIIDVDSSNQIYFRTDATVANVAINTLGWTDTRSI